jgi:hypothetical protein
MIKYIKSVLWRVAKRLSYIEDAQCRKVKQAYLNERPVMVLTGLSVGRSAQTVRSDIPAPGKQEEGSCERPHLSV